MPIDETAARAHVLRPAHVLGIVSSKGLDEDFVAPVLEFAGAAPGLYYLDVDGFGRALHAALQDQVAGYVVRLRQHGSSIYQREWNWAKTPSDGSQSWTPGVKMHVASCSKFVTATAVTRLLHDKGLSADTPIIGFLPNYWAKGPNIEKITFRHLLTHTSGFATELSDSDFEFMKAHVAAGVTKVGDYDYENMNFGLCRILIATVQGVIAPSATFSIPFLPNANDIVWDLQTIGAYVQYVQTIVFGPAGVSGATLDHPVGDALAYNQPVVGNGWNSGDLATMSGGAGWHLSVDDLLAVMGTLRRGGSIMSSVAAQAMLDDGFGIDIQRLTPMGWMYSKDGLWGKDGRLEQSALLMLPRDMELVAFANSPIGMPGKFLRDVVSACYLAAIQAGRSVRGYFERTGQPVTSSVHASAAPSLSVRQMLLN